MKKNDVEYLVKQILEYEFDEDPDKEEIMHLLLDSKVTKNINKSQKEGHGFGDRVPDGLTKVAGSWMFILSFIFILIIWVVGNATLLRKPFDPFPFILLNLVLSCIAALQAPIIMMSQNRQEIKDRLRSENDYRVNLKSEMITEDMHHKLDQLLSSQEQIIEAQRMLVTRLESLEL